MTEFLYTTLLLVAVALIVTLVTVPLASKIAWKVGSVDYPSMRRVNTKPTPRMGGIAVFMGIAAAYAVWALLATPLGLPSPDASVSGDVKATLNKSAAQDEEAGARDGRRPGPSLRIGARCGIILPSTSANDQRRQR